MELLQLLGRIASKIAPGRAPSFTEAHLIKALEEVKTRGEVGRVRLAETLGLSEGTTRTLIRHLKQNRLIMISRSGIRLSEKGMKLHSALREKMSKGIGVSQSPLTVGVFNVAVLVKSAGYLIRSGLEQRDAAIMMGAHGATTLVFSKNKLMMPGVTDDVFKDFPSIRATLLSELEPKENDVIIIGSATNRRTAEFGAIMAALQLLVASL
jgi:predicted transcriptional regulator